MGASVIPILTRRRRPQFDPDDELYGNLEKIGVHPFIEPGLSYPPAQKESAIGPSEPIVPIRTQSAETDEEPARARLDIAPPQPVNPFAAKSAELSRQQQELLANPPHPSLLRKILGGLTAAVTGPGLGREVLGYNQYERKLNTLGTRSNLLRQAMQTAEEQETGGYRRREAAARATQEEARAKLYGAQADELARRKSLPDIGVNLGEGYDAQGRRVEMFRKADGTIYTTTIPEIINPSSLPKGHIPQPGIDIPFPSDVEAQKRRIATAGAAQRAAEQEPIIEVAAKALIEPRNLTALKDIASLRTDQRLKIFARAKQLDPNFDPGLVNQRIRFLQAYEDPKGRAAINRQSINNIMQHAGDLSDLNKAYASSLRGGARFLNTPINLAARQFGSEAYMNYATTLGVLTDELSLYFAGGYAPVETQRGMWEKIIKEEATPAQVEAFTKEVVHLGLRRATTFNSQFKTNMGYDDPNMIVPEAAEAGRKLGLQNELSRFGSGGALTGATGPSVKGKWNPQTGRYE